MPRVASRAPSLAVPPATWQVRASCWARRPGASSAVARRTPTSRKRGPRRLPNRNEHWKNLSRLRSFSVQADRKNGVVLSTREIVEPDDVSSHQIAASNEPVWHDENV